MYPLKINEKYDTSKLASLSARFSTVYLGNYINGNFDENVGSHCGVDIIPVVKGQDVLAVLDGEVTKRENSGAYGNTIVIKHLVNGQTIYSCYLHLSSINTKVGTKVSEATVIGKTGNTGNSYGEHLHFQIDTDSAPFHPYWPFTATDSQKAGLSFMDSVNKGLNIENARKFTLNPLVFLDNIKNTQTNNTVKTETIVVEIPKVENKLVNQVVANNPAKIETTINSTSLNNTIEKINLNLDDNDDILSSNTLLDKKKL